MLVVPEAGLGRFILDDQIVDFDAKCEPEEGQQVLVVHMDGQIALGVFRARYTAGSTRYVSVDARVPDRFISIDNALLIGVVSDVTPTNGQGAFPLPIDVVRGLTVEANTGSGLRQRVIAQIKASARRGEVSTQVEFRDTPDDDYEAVRISLYEAGYDVTAPEKPSKRRDYGDEADLRTMTIGWPSNGKVGR